MLPKDRKALSEAKEAARCIQRYTQNITLKSLETNDEKQSAVFWQFVVLGEAVKRLSSEFREENSHIPWKDIAGMRDVLAHQYDDILLDIVWSVATTRVPEILAQIDPLLPAEPVTSEPKLAEIAVDLWSACSMAMQLNEQPQFTIELSQGLVEVTGDRQVVAMVPLWGNDNARDCKLQGNFKLWQRPKRHLQGRDHRGRELPGGKCLRPLRHARERVGMVRGPLARELRRSPD